jgi:hypothetical protein
VLGQLPRREVSVIRVFEARKIAVDEIEERDQHGQTGDISIAVIIISND